MAEKILITGSKGMLGRTLMSKLDKYELIPADLPEADITDAAGFEKLIAATKPDVVIHCAAMTAVDKCESEIEIAFKLNETGSKNVAESCNRHGCRLVAISTDYVFDGEKDSPYDEDDTPDPQNIYGKSKYAGEVAVRKYCPNHVIARVSWLYGPGGPSFVHTMIKLADGSRPELRVVNDQLGNPTSTFAVADALLNIIAQPQLKGTFHLTCEGETTWYDFAREIFKLARLEQKVIPCTSEEYKAPAKRPKNSRLHKNALKKYNLPPMQEWHDALEKFIMQEFQLIPPYATAIIVDVITTPTVTYRGYESNLFSIYRGR
eukprot:TRINITY_DN8670_c0_g3_i2.p2 TRINITY_DN8670_c0_g3~~TRINITY_DN8670_c0_g3_i2.p2  ORF type:complete len:319 (+),score=42.51 TRINITY_DN8670_c0_g3_i2:252-1208(+)